MLEAKINIPDNNSDGCFKILVKHNIQNGCNFQLWELALYKTIMRNHFADCLQPKPDEFEDIGKFRVYRERRVVLTYFFGRAQETEGSIEDLVKILRNL